MAYRIQTVNDVTSPDIPLGINLTDKNSGTFESIYFTDKQTLVNLKTLLLTRKGERYHQPTFGSNLLYIIFEPNVSALKEDIIDTITEAVNEWIPYISIETIDVITNEDDPTLEHNIKVTIEFSINNFDEQKITIFVNEDGTLLVG